MGEKGVVKRAGWGDMLVVLGTGEKAGARGVDGLARWWERAEDLGALGVRVWSW